MSIKVMLADDHVLMREGIRQLLEFDGTISVIAEANNGVECMEQLLSVHPDILLLDINMPVERFATALDTQRSYFSLHFPGFAKSSARP